MSLPGVLQRGDDVLNQFDRQTPLWNIASHATCLLAVGWSKLVLYTSYKPTVSGLERLDKALERSRTENRGLMTIMNHMSVVDDPFLWGCLPWRYYKDLDNIRWGLGAHNVCFQNKFLTYFFSLGKVLPTERFGVGPFQSSLDAAVRIMSPDDTLDLIYDGQEETNKAWLNPNKQELNKITPLAQKVNKEYIAPIVRSKPSWIHVFPEAFVLQLQPPFNNSMRYFKWGITRLILESTKQPIIVPIFSTGFEKIAPETAAGSMIERFLPANFGTEIKVTIGDPIDDKIIEKFRKEWLDLVKQHLDSNSPFDLTEELKFGEKAQQLRSKLSSELRKAVADIRHSIGFPEEDPRFKDHKFWHNFTKTEGKSDPDVQFIGQNWAIRRLQKFLQEHDEFEMTKEHEKTIEEKK